MSGDIGRGATKQAISYAIHLASTHNRPHGTCYYSNSSKWVFFFGKVN